MCHESVHSLQNKRMEFCISSQHLWQKLLQDHSQHIVQAQLFDLNLQCSLLGYVPPQIPCMETHSCITSDQNCIMFEVEDYSNVFVFCIRWLYLCDFFITAKTKCDCCLQWRLMNGCEKERGDNSLPVWNFIEMFAFCESKTVKYKHCILSLYIFSGIGNLKAKTFLCHKRKKQLNLPFRKLYCTYKTTFKHKNDTCLKCLLQLDMH
jgi:hypothetical protein